jgi:predicted Zn-dependent protease
MKHWLGLGAVVLLGAGVVVKSERDKVDVAPSPAAVLYFVADTERELTRMPMQLTRMPDAEEIRIGNQLASGYASFNRGDRKSAEMESYIQKVGAGLAAHAQRRLPYQFHYIADDSFVNAFAVPGGHVYIGKGLIALMDSEDQLAAVLGHEIEHIDHYHCAERVQQEQILRKIPMGELVALPIEVFEAGYTKDQELEADREGARLAVAAGYSSSGALRLFERLDRLHQEYQDRADNPGGELSQVAWQALAGYFRSHPLPSERIAQLKQLHLAIHQERELAVKVVSATNQSTSGRT